MKKVIPFAAILSFAVSSIALAQGGGVSHRETMKVPEQAPGYTTNQQSPSSTTPAPSDQSATSGSSAAPSPGTTTSPPTTATPSTNRDQDQQPGEMTRRPGRGGR